MEDKQSFFAIIPANVRYDKDLTPNAKLLYGEITALCNKEGYCWATNKYFADLYGVSKISISNWISQLVEKKYIVSNIICEENTKKILERKLSLPMNYIINFNDPIKENFNTPIKENFKDNNTIMNNTNNNIYSQICDYLNEKANTRYRPNSKKTQSLIDARLREKYTIDDFKKVIDNKVANWKGTEYEQYLRPETLFGNKFEGYLNEKIIRKKQDFLKHNYMKEQLNEVFDDLDNIEI